MHKILVTILAAASSCHSQEEGEGECEDDGYNDGSDTPSQIPAKVLRTRSSKHGLQHTATRVPHKYMRVVLLLPKTEFFFVASAIYINARMNGSRGSNGPQRSLTNRMPSMIADSRLLSIVVRTNRVISIICIDEHPFGRSLALSGRLPFKRKSLTLYWSWAKYPYLGIVVLGCVVRYATLPFLKCDSPYHNRE